MRNLIRWIMYVGGFATTGAALAQVPGTGLLLEEQAEYLKREEAPVATRGTLPASRTLRASFPDARSQGKMGSCTAFAATYLKAYRVFESVGRKGSPDAYIQSPAFLYSALTGNQCDSGTYIHHALAFMERVGSVSWQEFPYSEDKCDDWRPARSAAKFRSSVAYRLSDNPTVALRQIKEAIADGSPIILSMDACKEFANPSTGYITQEEPGGNCESHAVLAVGYDDDIRALQILNSWGPRWGVGGAVWMNYEVFLKRYLKQAFVDFGPGQDPSSLNFEWLKEVKSEAGRRRLSAAVAGKQASEISQILSDPTSLSSSIRQSSANVSPVIEQEQKRGYSLGIALEGKTKEEAFDVLRESVVITPQSLANAISTNIADFAGVYADISGIRKPVSEWSIWLNLKKEQAEQVEKVSYYFFAKSFRNPKRSQPGSSIFLATWLGHGCAHNAQVVVELKDGKKITSNFDFCAAITRSQPDRRILFSDFLPNVSPSAPLLEVSRLFFTNEKDMRDMLPASIPVRPISRTGKILNIGKARTFFTAEEIVSNELTEGRSPSLGFLAKKDGSYIVCKNGQPIGLECPAYANSYEFAEDISGSWKLRSIYRNISAIDKK